jgi:hypothetical protein
MREEPGSDVSTIGVTDVVISSPMRFQAYKTKRKPAKIMQ